MDSSLHARFREDRSALQPSPNAVYALCCMQWIVYIRYNETIQFCLACKIVRVQAVQCGWIATQYINAAQIDTFDQSLSCRGVRVVSTKPCFDEQSVISFQ